MFRLARGRAAGKTKIAEGVLDAEHEITHRAYQLRFVAVAILLAGMFAFAFVPLAAWAILVRIAGHGIPSLGTVGFVLLLVIGTAPGVSLPAATPVGDQALDAERPRALQHALDKAIDKVRKVVVDLFEYVRRTIVEWLSRVVKVPLMPVLARYFLVDFRVREI